MPNIKSAIKRAQTSEANRKVNVANKSRMNTARRAFDAVLANADAAANAEAFKALSSAIDKAAKQGVISKNAAARRKSRAFKKLAELKPHIQWWEAGALPPQFLVAGDVAMTTAFSGRIDAAQREGQNLKITWTGGIYDLDFWVMPKGGANKEAAMKFIALASSPDAQAEYARHISYGPTHTKAMAKIDPKVQALLPTSPANSKDALRFDVAFWADQGEALEKRFAAWAAQ